jgi:hypothetical protein
MGDLMIAICGPSSESALDEGGVALDDAGDGVAAGAGAAEIIGGARYV